MVPLGDEVQVEARFGLLDIVLILMQDRCMVCIECTIGTEIILDAPDGPSRMWNLTSFRLEIVLVSVQERCMVCARCTIGLNIILDAPDGTPRSRGLCGTLLLSVSRQCWCRCKIGGWFALDVP